MSPVITLRTGLVAACAVVAVALTGCSGTATDPHDGASRAAGHHQDPDVLADLADLAAQLAPAAPAAPATIDRQAAAQPQLEPVASTAAEPPAPVPTVVATPAPAVAAVEPAPAEPTCTDREVWDPTVPACVAQQLPEESAGGARCPDPAHVVVAIHEDGTAVCGPADDTVAGA